MHQYPKETALKEPYGTVGIHINLGTIQDIDAFLELHKSTGDEQYRNSVKRAIDFAVEEFTLSQAYPQGINDRWFNNQKRVVPFFSHDIKVVNGQKTVAPSYCMGCVFFMLNHIWDYNDKIADSPGK